MAEREERKKPTKAAMTPRGLLELQASIAKMALVCPHGVEEDCWVCEERRVASQVAKELLARGDEPTEATIREWAEEFDRRIREYHANHTTNNSASKTHPKGTRR